MSAPGLESFGALNAVSFGGASDWRNIQETKLFTNAFIIKPGKVLLGYKKRGYGKGMWNGFGGKVDPGETPAEAAVRELQEEAEIDAPLVQCGTLLFTTEDAPYAFHIHVYRGGDYTGTPAETDEMRPAWFSTGNLSPSPGTVAAADNPLPPIPYDLMWEDDQHWFPLMLAKRPFVGRADFGREDGKYVLRRWWFGTTGGTN